MLGRLRGKPAYANLRFVVIGTGRCGTQSAASALTRAGLPCGHEDVFTPSGPRRATQLWGDSSWLAVPYLDAFQGEVVHLVREPLATVQSFLDLGFFEPAVKNRFTRFARKHMPLTGHPIDDAFRWYYEWNAACERHANARFRLDEIDLLVAHLAVALSHHHPHHELLEQAKRDRYNAQPEAKRRGHVAAYESISDARLLEDVLKIAERYGFNAGARSKT